MYTFVLVSLCVREWIEILSTLNIVPLDTDVSLCVREWIEIIPSMSNPKKVSSPSA